MGFETIELNFFRQQKVTYYSVQKVHDIHFYPGWAVIGPTTKLVKESKAIDKKTIIPLKVETPGNALSNQIVKIKPTETYEKSLNIFVTE